MRMASNYKSDQFLPHPAPMSVSLSLILSQTDNTCASPLSLSNVIQSYCYTSWGFFNWWLLSVQASWALMFVSQCKLFGKVQGGYWQWTLEGRDRWRHAATTHTYEIHIHQLTLGSQSCIASGYCGVIKWSRENSGGNNRDITMCVLQLLL